MQEAIREVWAGLTTRRLLVAILFIAIFAMAIRQPTDTDTWWHLKSGQLMWETGQVLRTDPFSHTVAGQPWFYPSWLVQILFWLVYRIWGLAGLALLLATAVTATLALIYLQCEGRPYIAAFATLLAAIASSIIWAIRPQIVTFVLAALVTYLLYRYKNSGNARWLWPIPLLAVLWVNCHAGFVVLFVLLGCYLVGETLNRLTAPTSEPPIAGIAPLLVVTLVSIPLLLLNPHTTKVIAYAFQTVSIGPLQDFILEWAAPDFHNIQLHPFIWLLLLLLIAMGLSRRSADWTDLALVGVFGYMGLLAVRNTALFALVAAPVLSRHTVAALNELALVPRLSWLGVLTHTLSPSRVPRGLILLNVLILVLIVAGAGIKITWDLVGLGDPEVWGEGLPLQATDYLRGHDLPGQMFNTYNWGGYLIWSLYPDKPVFVDGRTDLYALNSQVLEDYVKLHWTRPGWRQVLDKYGIGYVLTERTGLLDVLLSETEGWEIVYSDDLAVIYVRAEETR